MIEISQIGRRIHIVGLLTVLLSVAVLGQTKVPEGSKIFIAPMDGNLHGFIAPEIVKKKLPVLVVMEERMPTLF